MVTISKDTPCLSITTVALRRSPVFRTDTIKTMACAALDEARWSGGFALFAYVIMPDHLHVLTNGARKPSDTARFINGVLSRRVIGHLKERGFASSLDKLRCQEKRTRLQIFACGPPLERAVADERRRVHGARELHPSESGASRSRAAGGRVPLVERAVLVRGMSRR